MDILGIDNIKEQQQIAEFERKMKQKKQKLDKKLTRQKILIGAFVIEQLNKDDENLSDFKKVIAENFEGFLTRETDKELMSAFIKNLKKSVKARQNDKSEQQHTGQNHQDSIGNFQSNINSNQASLLGSQNNG